MHVQVRLLRCMCGLQGVENLGSGALQVAGWREQGCMHAAHRTMHGLGDH